MKTLAFPMPAFVIGANVDGKPNFMTAAWSGIAGSAPPMITVALPAPSPYSQGNETEYDVLGQCALCRPG